MKLATVLALFAWAVMPKRRRITIDNINMAFGQQRSTQLAFLTFRHFAAVTLECMMGRYWFRPERQRWIRLAEGSTVSDLHKPCLAVTAHFGQWELFPVIADGVRFVPIYQKLKSAYWNDVFFNLRQQLGVSGLIDKTEFSKNYQKIISENNCLAFAADQGRGCQYTFMGQMTSFPRSIAHIAYRSKRPVIFGVGLRNGLYIDYHITKPITIKHLESKSDFQKRLMSAYVSWLESWVKEHPEQYLWLHNLWKRNKEPNS
tara:strand:+ start:392 stop:1168 length:777 start_codon:yes stop_codon:yes gene_type:complete